MPHHRRARRSLAAGNFKDGSPGQLLIRQVIEAIEVLAFLILFRGEVGTPRHYKAVEKRYRTSTRHSRVKRESRVSKTLLDPRLHGDDAFALKLVTFPIVC